MLGSFLGAEAVGGGCGLLGAGGGAHAGLLPGCGGRRGAVAGYSGAAVSRIGCS
jgi:hypothetical protein